jgi:signal transduction histidine kinase
MSPELHLDLHNVTTIISVVILFGVSFFLFIKGPKREADITMSLAVFFVGFFFLSHLFGINIVDPELSRKVLMFNTFTIFIGTFNLHAILAVFDKAKDNRILLFIIHSSSAFLVVFFFIFPDLFLLDSVSKMYFINYYNPGILNWVRLTYLFGITVPLIFYFLRIVFKETQDATRRMQVRFLAGSLFAGYLVGFIPNFLVYDIEIDPLWGTLTAFIFSVPFVYGVIRYKLFDIAIIAKKALYYGLLIFIVGLAMAGLNYSTNWIENFYPGFPVWTMYVLSGLIAVIVSTIVWEKLRETDQLKYEFITTITHKLRTPMTGIKWAIENLSSLELSMDAKIQIGYIGTENAKLIELTNMLMGVSKIESGSYVYNIKRANLSFIIDHVVELLGSEIKEKNIKINKLYSNDSTALFDSDRTSFVAQVLLENALRYSNNGSSIDISINSDNKYVTCMVKDYGIGISKSDIGKLFNKFYRSEHARSLDTEGVGIGLFMAKEIVIRHGGKIWAESLGENKGSSFYFSLPKK